MRNTDLFRNKKVTIVGFARSGLTSANLLFDLGAEVSVTDINDNQSTRSNLAKLKSKAIKFELGRHTQDFIQGRDIVILSPGVISTASAVVFAKNLSIPVISEIELSAMLCPATIIAVTGSNGKTTTTTLIGKILESVNKNVFVCGNIGNPFSGELQKMDSKDFVCLEVSSFQLETIAKFKPKISVILNFSQNHLDWYSNMGQYLAAKKRIFMNQDGNDYLVLNADDPALRQLHKETKARVVYFSQSKDLNPNQAAVVAVGSILGISKDKCLEVFREFKGVEHRQEEVACLNNIRFVNDSKATTVESTMWALTSISGPIILIAGGKDKGLDYSQILELALRKVREIILIGQARVKIKEALKGYSAISQADSLEEAVRLAFKKAHPGDTVLLSPMCSSYDMFKDYEERGRQFKEIVQKLVVEFENKMK